MRESEFLEFKREFTPSIYKEVVAFLNTEGGEILVGVDDDGNVFPLDDFDRTYTSITNGIKDAISPDATMFIKYKSDDNGIIRIIVSEGTSKPYFLIKKGLKPSGVFVRQGSTSIEASSEMIKKMIKDTDGDEWESLPAEDQEFTFNYMKEIFKKCNKEFSEEKYRLLGLRDRRSLYTNLAMLLSDQNPYTIKVAVFSNLANTNFLDMKEFSGSVFEEIEETLKYLALANSTKSTIKGLFRVDSPSYSEWAIREVLLNSVIHRDYSYSASIIINVNSERIEFISLGGLLSSLNVNDIKSGVSLLRNRNLASVFHRLELIESYGTGIRRIYELYENLNIKPDILVTEHTFKFILPNMNNSKKNTERNDYYDFDSSQDTLSDSTSKRIFVSKQEQHVLDSFSFYKDGFTEDEVSKELGLKRTRTYLILRSMCEKNLIYSLGRGEEKRYYQKERG